MGSNSSKATITDPVKPELKHEIGANADPRSPTPEIVRTPLHSKNGGGKHNITKNIDLRKTFEEQIGDEKNIHNNPILSAVIKSHLQMYDPRSPTQDFERTPIVITSKIQEPVEDNFGSPCLKQDITNESISLPTDPIGNAIAPKNLCNDFLDSTLDDTVPLGSSTASNDSITKNVSIDDNTDKPKHLLETNFDYIETNEKELEEESHKIDNVNEDDSTPVEIQTVIDKFKVLNADPRSPTTGIDRTPIVVPKIDEEETPEENVDVEEMSDDTLLKVLQSTNAELRESIKNTNKNQEGLMIYEDETNEIINATPKKSKSASNSGSRTPLSCMKNKGDTGHARSKSANTLYCDPKDQRTASLKNPKRASHIPRLKSLTKQSTLISGSSISLKSISKVSAVTGDCENTPPNSHRDCWDKDNSIVL